MKRLMNALDVLLTALLYLAPIAAAWWVYPWVALWIVERLP